MNETTTDAEFSLKTAKERAVAILIDSDVSLQESLQELEKARELASKAGLSVESSILNPVEINTSDGGNPATNTNGTGGHSNTDHIVATSGDACIDRIAELKRNLLRRHRAMQPEDRGDDRWDKPKLPGERRRRIIREQDKDEYPPEPPISGWYVIMFVCLALYCFGYERMYVYFSNMN